MTHFWFQTGLSAWLAGSAACIASRQSAGRRSSSSLCRQHANPAKVYQPAFPQLSLSPRLCLPESDITADVPPIAQCLNSWTGYRGDTARLSGLSKVPMMHQEPDTSGRTRALPNHCRNQAAFLHWLCIALMLYASSPGHL